MSNSGIRKIKKTEIDLYNINYIIIYELYDIICPYIIILRRSSQGDGRAESSQQWHSRERQNHSGAAESKQEHHQSKILNLILSRSKLKDV